MTEQWWDDAERDPIHEAAADWYVRLQDSAVSLDDTLAWQQWMGADPRHAEAFARIEEADRQLSAAPRAKQETASMLTRDRYDGSMPVSDWRAPSRRVPLFAIAASVLVTTIGASWALIEREVLPWQTPPNQTVSTSIGENRSLTLADGSSITLGGNTEVQVTFSPTARHIELVRGEAFFAVAKDVSRPFTVHAGDTNVTAVGTEFNVRRGADRVVVAVIEGRVVVNSTPALAPIRWFSGQSSMPDTVHVDAGQQTIAREAVVESATALPDPAAAIAWQSGRLAFEREALRYVLEDVNRYAVKPIVVGDDSIGELKVTGTVLDSNVVGWIASLENAFGLRAVEESERIVLRQAVPQP